MISVLRAVYSSAHSCIPGTDKEQRVLEKQHTKEEHIGSLQVERPLTGSPCSPRDSQESSPTPQFKRINSSKLSFLYSPTLTSIQDYRKNHSFD